MKAILLRGINDLQVGELPAQKLGPRDVRVKIAYNGICGSDRHIIDGNLGAATAYPIIMGHEMSGTVVELGSETGSKGLKIGDRVTGSPAYYCGTCEMCRSGKEHFCDSFLANIPPGTMAESVVWKEQQIFKLPEGMELDVGAFAEPVAAALRGIERADIVPGSTVAISGAGPIGLLQLQLAKLCGAASVTMIDVVPSKLEMAKAMGADAVIDAAEQDVVDAAMELTDDRGYERVIESSGSRSGAENAFNIIARGGRLNCFAVYPADYFMPVHLATMYFKEATLVSTFFYPYLFPRAVRMLSRVDVRPLISKVFELEDGIAAFEANKDPSNMKILIKSN